jgi:hypothetical protein
MKRKNYTAALFMSSADFAVDLIETARASLRKKNCHKASSLMSQINEQVGQARGIALQLMAEKEITTSKKRKSEIARDLKLIRSDMEILSDSRKQLLEAFDASCSCEYNVSDHDEYNDDYEVPEGAPVHGLEGAVKSCVRYERGSSGKLRCKQWSAGPGYAEGPHARAEYFSQNARKVAGLKKKYRYRKSLPYNPRPGDGQDDVRESPLTVELAKRTQKKFSTLPVAVRSDILSLAAKPFPMFKPSKKMKKLMPPVALLLPGPDDGEESEMP